MMICKEDLVSWFKNLESYKRIDVMCTLLNLCLPFELRFLGTCLEELGRRDAQDLRGVELRVNNPQEFVSDVGSFQSGQPTDMKIRRKMALYLALMRACNRTGVNELFKTLDRWGDRDFSKFSDGDPLQELLLVYTMATNHPVFSFEQRLKCGEIYSKITSSKAHLNQQSSTSTSPITSPLSSSFSVQQHQTASPPPFQSATFQQPTPQMINPQQLPNPILMPMAAFQQAALISGDPSASTIALSVDSLPSHAHIVTAPPNMVPIPTDFTTPPPPWRFQPQIYPAIVPIETQQQYPPQSSSPPHMSQPSSPTQSRTGSPTRQQQQQQQSQPPTTQNPPPSHRNNRNMRNARPTNETTPPLQQQATNTQTTQQTQGSGTINYIGNDIMVHQTLKNFEELNMDGAISQLHSLTLRNGYNRPSNTIPRQNKPNWTTLQWQIQQQQQQQQQQPHALNYTMHIVDPNPMQLIQQQQQQQQQQLQQQHKSGGSESGSSTGDMSPPPQQQTNQQTADPVLLGNANQTQSSGLRNKQALNLNRLNGGNSGVNHAGSQQQQMHHSNSSNNLDFNGSPSNPSTSSSNSSGNLLLIGGGTIPMHNPYPPYRNVLPGAAPIQQRQFPAQVNGEINLYPFNAGATFIPAQQAQVVASVVPPQRVSPSQTPPVLLPTPYPTNKLVQSCFNCGSTNHTGLNCSEASMEDVTRNAVYKLDYTVSTQSAPQFAPVPVMTSSSSSGNLIQTQMQMQSSNNQTQTPNNNSEPEPSITFIDLTQDTSSDSSISNR